MTETEEIFVTAESEARLDLIKHLIENSELVPLVRGMSGIGKTLLASRLQASAPKNWVVCHFDADSMMQPERLLAQIARCNGLPDAKDDNIRRLVERFEALRKRGSIPVLLIDDAQELPPTSLITLLRLYERQVGGGPLLSLVLFANEQIDMLLSTPQLQIMSPQSIQVIDLPSLTREEADAYMRHLLRVEELDEGLALDSSRMNRIYRESRGAPGPLASAILKEVGESGEETRVGGFKLNAPLIWGAVPLALLLLLVLVFQGPINRIFTADTDIEDEPALAEVTRPQTDTEPAPIDLPLPASMKEEEMGAGERTESAQSAEDPTPPVSRVDGDLPSVEPTEAVQTPGEALSRTGPSPEPGVSEAEPSPVSQEEEHVSVEILADDGTSKGSLEEAPEEATQGAGQTDPAPPSPAPGEEEIGKRGVGEPPEPVAAPPEIGASPVPERTAAESPEQQSAPGMVQEPLMRSPAWLQEQAGNSYTIQLLAVENIESIQSVIAKYQLREKAFSVRTQRRGRDWYPLLWGVYPDRNSAVEAIKQLPRELQKGGAWARPIASFLP